MYWMECCDSECRARLSERSAAEAKRIFFFAIPSTVLTLYTFILHQPVGNVAIFLTMYSGRQTDFDMRHSELPSEGHPTNSAAASCVKSYQKFSESKTSTHSPHVLICVCRGPQEHSGSFNMKASFSLPFHE